MSRHILTLALVTFCIQCCVGQNKTNMTPFDYEKAWKEVNDLESKGLPESILKLVNEIYLHAKAEENAGQLVKAVIHQLKFTDFKEEDALIKNLIRLKEEALHASSPSKPLLHSMLAELYWQYYQNNQYEFLNRSETINTDENNIETWSLAKIVQETFYHYKLSLNEAEKSKTAKVDVYEPVIHKGNVLGQRYRPTLYDFLAHRAVSFFSSAEPNIIKPAYSFTLDKEDYLADAREFIKLKIESKDSLSAKYYALTILQDLMRFHSNDADPVSFVELDLQRLQFVKTHLTLPNKNDLYFKALEQLENSVMNNPIAGKVTAEKARVLVETGALYAPLQSDSHKWDIKKAFELCEAAKKKFPDSDGAIICENIQDDIGSKSIRASIEENNVPEQPFRSLVYYKNFTDLYYRVIKVSRDEVQALRTKTGKDYSEREKKFIEYFTLKKPLKTGKFKLPDDGDYQQHSVEVKIDALPIGEYMVLYSHRENFAITDNALAYAFTTVSNISYVHRTLKTGETEFHVLHRETGEPIAGVNASVYIYKYNNSKETYEVVKLKNYVSDEKGYFKILLIKDEYSRSLFVNFSKGTDTNSTAPIDWGYYNPYRASINQYPIPELDVHTSIFFFLDRAIYRPGQTIYFKGLVVSTDNKTSQIIPKHSTTISLLDVNYQEQGSVHVVSNEYGTFSGSFIAPSNGLTGEMRIQSTDGSGSISFSVEEYKRPKFEVGFDPIKTAFRLQDLIKVGGYARAYSGANIDGATVKYRVVREANFPFWWWCRWGYYPSSPEMEIVNGETKSDANGKFDVNFQAIPDLSVDKSSDPTFTYTVYADVTDINGETHSSSTSVSVGYKSLLVGVAIDNINQDEKKDLKKEFTIRTTNLAGEFIAAKGQIKIFALRAPERTFRNRLWEQPDKALLTREEYYKQFPRDLFEDENNKFKWLRSKETFSLNFDTNKSKTFEIPEINNWHNGEYVLEITSTDSYGQDVKEVSYFTVYAMSAKAIPSPAVNYFQGGKMSAEPGEKASFAAGTAVSKINVLYEIERDGAILSKEWLTLKNEQRLFEIPIKEEYRGNVAVHYTFVKDNRLYAQTYTISIPYTNKELDISFESFRDKLQPGENEEWKILIKGKTADKVVAEMVATLYDASLDEFRMQTWYANFYNNMYSRLGWQSVNGFALRSLQEFSENWNHGHSRSAESPYFDSFNWFGYNAYQSSRRYKMAAGMVAPMSMAKSEEPSEELKESVVFMDSDDTASKRRGDASESLATSKNRPEPKSNTKIDLSEVKVRKNFNETAFFYPHLQTNEKGEIIVKFTVPEALTRWKMLGFAHTKDLKSGLTSNQLVTQKDIMVVPNQPRFFRENDTMKFSAKISSLVDNELSGQAQLEFFDALTMKPIDDLMKNQNKSQNFHVKSRQSTNLEWSIEIPEGIQAITYRIVAKAGNFSDGEEMVLPVVTNRMLITETLPLPIRGKQTKEFRFEKLINNKSTTLRHQRYTLEFTSNPAWYAIQSLPYLMEYPYDCIEQTFSKFYANSIASHIANSNPRIKQVFDTWKNIQPDALLSNLEKNQELKSALLEETPWVLQAKDESQRKRMVSLLFDLNRMSNEQERALDKIQKAQNANGAFSWFPGFPEDRYMTQHIIAGMGHLDVMGVKSVRENDKTWTMITNALQYLDGQIQNDYDHLKELAKKKVIKLDDNNISYFHFHYLYTRSYFKDQEISAANKEAFNYFLTQAKKYWLVANNMYLQGMTCLALNRFGDKTITAAMIKSFSERALHSEEMGMYWKNDGGYYWYQAPIETQALMIEVYDEVAKDIKSVEDLKVWLLKQKQTQDWKTTKATVEACYALLRRGTDVLANNKLVDIKVGNQIIDPAKREDTKIEAGTGYFKTAWQANEVTTDMGKITISKTDDGVAWGAVYWQYFEQLDKITPAETPLKIKKDLFLQQNTDRGPVITAIDDKSSFNIGDLVKVKIELRVDRNMEYVHLKDMRAAGFEPVSTLSTYKYQDGLYYYESPRDLATNFFIGYLPKGTYVFEYALRVSQKGNFSNGVTTIQCMYAPEFTSHSQGIRINVK